MHSDMAGRHRPLSFHITTFAPGGSGAKRGHTADMNEWPKLGSGEEATNDRNWVQTRAPCYFRQLQRSTFRSGVTWTARRSSSRIGITRWLRSSTNRRSGVLAISRPTIVCVPSVYEEHLPQSPATTVRNVATSRWADSSAGTAMRPAPNNRTGGAAIIPMSDVSRFFTAMSP